jgi:uncharacterized protein (DUF3820 family)
MAQTEEKLNIEKIFDKDNKYVAIKIPNMYLGYYTFLDKKQEFKDGKIGSRLKCTLLIERSILGDSIEKEIRKELHAYAERESLLIDSKNKTSVFIDNGYSSTTSEFYNDKYSITLEKRINPDIAVKIYKKGEEIDNYNIFKTAGAKVNAVARFCKSKKVIANKELFYAAFSLSSVEMLELGQWPTNKYGGPLKNNSDEENFLNHPFKRKNNFIDDEVPF